MLSDAEALERVNAHPWYHGFELRPGVVTPGKNPTDARAWLSERYGLDENLRGKAALDIGALDGPYTFEMERRGANVVALDIQNPNVTGFNLAREVIGSQSEYVQGNVYELSALLGERKFDLVTFFGVWYHLKNPVRAFEEIRRVMKDDGLLLFEGEFLHHYAEAPGYSPDQLRKQAQALAESELPVCLFYGNGYRNDHTNWSVPNKACIMQWLSAAALELERFCEPWTRWPMQRIAGRARARAGAIVADNPVW